MNFLNAMNVSLKCINKKYIFTEATSEGLITKNPLTENCSCLFNNCCENK